MKQLADDVFQLGGFPPNAVNIYLVNGVLIDAGTRFDRGRILRQIEGRTVTAHALTHAHPDHQGASHAVCSALGIPLWCGENDAAAVEDPSLIRARQPNHWINRMAYALVTGPAHHVSRRLREGDDVAGLRVIETPGHSIGHVAYWRESDRVLILGDVLTNMNLFTTVPGLHEPPALFSPDPARNRQSARQLAALKPALACFGHGPPLRDPNALARFVDGLKD